MTKQQAIIAIRGFVAASGVETRKAIARPQFAELHGQNATRMLDEAETLADRFNLGNPFSV